MPHPPLAKAAAADRGEQLPLEERVQMRAYELYVLRGNESGSELDDWLQAEDEIRDAEEELAKSRGNREALSGSGACPVIRPGDRARQKCLRLVRMKRRDPHGIAV